MKIGRFGTKRLGTGLMVLGTILTVGGAVGAILTKSKDEDANESYDGIDVCEKGNQGIEEVINEFSADEEDDDFNESDEIEESEDEDEFLEQ